MQGQMSSRQVQTNTDDLTKQSSKLGLICFYQIIGTQTQQDKKFANPEDDIAASSEIVVLFS